MSIYIDNGIIYVNFEYIYFNNISFETIIKLSILKNDFIINVNHSIKYLVNVKNVTILHFLKEKEI